MNVNPVTTPEKMEALRLRLDTLRDELSVFSAAADDDRHEQNGRIRSRAVQHVPLGELACERPPKRQDAVDPYNAAEEVHLKALTLVRIVLDLVRGRDVAQLEAQLRQLEKYG
jgi:hypothetical protein